ncbi:glycosyltransferase family 4 protein [Streptomyces chiangmaiensis]|uniref:Glycosyltransferase family 4 protein n=1 Tax=Streptomyces chiangmaiensis TaxID=766497 RepID=A0ABU7FRS4_9ACTN|nr:glycosyltransferase family 4 protein [Streptomyces chiangmaiensis]MED7826630.1 glycosyltransferase family 4 protein [Streptomyces chiangmaiensis]
MPTIVQITPYYPPHLGGLERVVSHLAQQLAERHDVRVLTTALGSAGVPRKGLENGVAVHRYRAVEVAHTALAPGLAAGLARVPRDAVLHLHCAHALLPELVALTTRLRGMRFLLHFHLDVDASGRLGALLPYYKRHVLGRVLRAAAGVIVLTSEQAAFLTDTYRVPAERVHVVPNGVAGTYFMPVRETASNPLKLLYVGRLSAQKNVARLLQAMSMVRGAVQLRVVGDGELRTGLEAQSDQLGLENVEFSGGLLGEELVKAYADADAFVLASDKEGMPLVVLEAMAAALPVVATDVPGTRELVAGTGLLAKPEPAALAESIDAVAADPVLRHRLAVASAERARSYSWEAVARRVEDVYAKAGL